MRGEFNTRNGHSNGVHPKTGVKKGIFGLRIEFPSFPDFGLCRGQVGRKSRFSKTGFCFPGQSAEMSRGFLLYEFCLGVSWSMLLGTFAKE